MSEVETAGLRRADVDPDPFVQFERWFEEAKASALLEPTAAGLATAGADGRPSCRTVLMKGFDSRGFVFYTNYEGRKAAELAVNAHACMNFWWDLLFRQVRIEGAVSRVSAEQSNAYFDSRPLGSRIGAWASAQSEVLASRDVLENEMRATSERFAGQEVLRPPHWGGFRIEPESIEFWQGQPSRLHDRLRYRRVSGDWIIERLSP